MRTVKSFKITSADENNDLLTQGTTTFGFIILVGLTLHSPNPDPMNPALLERPFLVTSE
jgi:hypothetical protein